MSRIHEAVSWLAESDFRSQVDGRTYSHPLARLVLSDGVEETPRARPPEIRRGRAGRCFATASRLAFTHPALVYVEGYALHDQWPTHHAWLSDGGYAIEVTWERPATAYFGVRVQMVDVARWITRYRVDAIVEAHARATLGAIVPNR